ncbi:glutathione S-transferase family protein [Oricola indica]|jgi:glutathione S-transferase|uniref:glutathione S-transferase family protein n=1 Tax=Oricola indica TaxID=2872591 RepID=UPI001CBEB0EF|nr:glutathione S-transferase [Oricola indica]
MYRLYWAEGTASFAPQAVLEEAGLAYELVRIDTTKGEHGKPDYLAINPAGRVPALELPDGAILTESAAISLYLAERHGLEEIAPAVMDPDRGTFLRWLFYLAVTLQEAYKPFYYPERWSADPGDRPRIRARAAERIIECWQPVEAHLAANGPYHLGERFSLADIFVLMNSTWHVTPEQLVERFPAVGRCIALASKRPVIARCLAQQKRVSVGRL